MIGEIYVEERRYEQIRNILKNEIETSKKYPTFYARIMFMYADLYMKLKDFDKTLEVVKQAVAYFSKANDIVIICYFVLIKCLVSLF
jgi:tetratricopeptide (TPR) repeat protein